MSKNFADVPFTVTGSTTSRTIGARFGEVLNVKDFGAVADNSHNDTTNIQACLDAAFGSSSSPHGSANAQLNKRVWFPAGQYVITAPLVLTRVVGGSIFGDGLSSNISASAGVNIFNINGAAHLRIEKFRLAASGAGICIDLNWDNASGGDGLHNNLFSDLLMTGDTGIRVANAGNQGHGNIFIQCSGSGMGSYGINIVGANAFANQVVLGGIQASIAAYNVAGGSIILQGTSTAGNPYDLIVSSGNPCAVIGGRTENPFLNLSSGIVTVHGFTQSAGGSTTMELAHITGGKAIFDGTYCDSAGKINGNAGSLYLRGCTLGATTPLSGYSGTVAENI